MKVTREQIDTLFEREIVADIIPSKEVFTEHVLADKPFHIYFGIDPTAERIHLGHVQNILFLEDMRRLGAKVTLLFGLFTGLVGDPSGRESLRPHLTPAQVRKNVRLWRRQIAPILHLSRFGGAKIGYNNRWFDMFSMSDFLTLMQSTTVQQLLERDMFRKRMEDGKPLYTHEMIYPILQGYDSVAMRVDAELCGTDQTFNALVGRTMVRRYLKKEKFVIAMELIQADGVMMSKSTGTGVFVDMEEGGNHKMFGSIMALPDSFILPLFRGCTRVPMDEVRAMHVSGGTATRDAKLRLASEIITLFWGTRHAQEAKNSYVRQFSEKAVPDNAVSITFSDNASLLDIVVKYAASSNADAKRKFAQGAVSLDGEKITDVQYALKKGNEHILRVGRLIFKLQ